MRRCTSLCSVEREGATAPHPATLSSRFSERQGRADRRKGAQYPCWHGRVAGTRERTMNRRRSHRLARCQIGQTGGLWGTGNGHAASGWRAPRDGREWAAPGVRGGELAAVLSMRAATSIGSWVVGMVPFLFAPDGPGAPIIAHFLAEMHNFAHETCSLAGSAGDRRWYRARQCSWSGRNVVLPVGDPLPAPPAVFAANGQGRDRRYWWATNGRRVGGHLRPHYAGPTKHRIGEKRDAVFRGVAGLRCQPSLAKASTTSGGA